MPLYIADYLADTAHLTATESGAYLHLIMHYWQHGSLPEDDDRLARIAAGMAVEQWRLIRPTIQAFFQDGWRHKRIDAEFEKSHERSMAGRLGGLAKAKQNDSKSVAPHPHPHPHLDKKDKKENLFDDGEVEKSGERPAPRHGAVSPKYRTIYIAHGTEEWLVYAADFKAVRGAEPIPNRFGGYWFMRDGEAKRPVHQFRRRAS
jgi:uncharacterized protein YdaU (DUF1376 family)